MLFRSTNTKDGDIFYVEDKEIGLRELAMNVAIPTDPGQRTVKGDMLMILTRNSTETMVDLCSVGKGFGRPASLSLEFVSSW